MKFYYLVEKKILHFHYYIKSIKLNVVGWFHKHIPTTTMKAFYKNDW